MESRNHSVPALPPLIDFDDPPQPSRLTDPLDLSSSLSPASSAKSDAPFPWDSLHHLTPDPSPLSQGVQSTHVSEPLSDPFAGFESLALSPAGSSCSHFGAEPRDSTYTAASPLADDYWSQQQGFCEVEFSAYSDRSWSDRDTRNSAVNEDLSGDKDALSETSPNCVSYPQLDFLSSDKPYPQSLYVSSPLASQSSRSQSFDSMMEHTNRRQSMEEINATGHSKHKHEASDSERLMVANLSTEGAQKENLQVADKIDSLVPFELRPPPLQIVQYSPIAFACTNTDVWLADDQGILVWDIESAWSSRCDGNNNLESDKDAAEYTRLPLQISCPASLFSDLANNIMWVGHKDGSVTAWPFVENWNGKDVADKNIMSFTWRAHQTPVLAIAMTTYGELWTGADDGSLRAWPSDVLGSISLGDKPSRTVVETSYIDLKTRGTAAGASTLSGADIRFLVAEHSQGRVWSGGSHVLALWDALTRDVLKVFGPNAEAEFTSPNISPVRAISKGDDLKTNTARFSKKDKAAGALNFLQRSRNVVFGAADAVLRVAVGGQSADDSRKMEALVATADGNIWIGYGNGRLVQFDVFGNRVAEHYPISTAVHCMCAFGNQLIIGYADGTIRSLDTNSGKQLGVWRGHKSSLAGVAVSSNHLFTLADNGEIRGWFTISPSLFIPRLHSRMISKASTYIREENLKIFTCTWNVGQEKASFDSLTRLLSDSLEASIVVVGLQEVEMGAGALAMAAAKETVGLAGSINGQWWLDNIGNILNEKKRFIYVASRQLAGLVIGAWVSKELRPYVGGIDVGAVACGFGRAFGNKGAVAVKLMVFRRTICIVNGHFAAHIDAVAKRNADFEHIYQRMTFGKLYGGVGLAATAMAASAVQMIRNATLIEGQDILKDEDKVLEEGVMAVPELSEADLLIWVGDFNYRLADVSYHDATSVINSRKWEYLLQKDQLRAEMKAGRVFQGMREADITFPPTYKFDKGCKDYDSSEKRVPAWCDRVIYRDSFDKSESSNKIGLLHPISATVSRYQAHMEPTESDHKPVSCLFNVHIAVINEAARRWEYGRFVHVDAEAHRLWKQINFVPEIQINNVNVKLIDKNISKLKVSNLSSDESALFVFRCERQTLEENVGEIQRGWNGLPSWLQVLPASGLLRPGQIQDISFQYVGSHIEFDSTGHTSRQISMILEVRGVLSATCRQNEIKVFISVSPNYTM